MANEGNSLNMDYFSNPTLLLKAVEEDMKGQRGRIATEAGHHSYEYYEEYFSFLTMKRLLTEGYEVGNDNWNYSGYKEGKIYFTAYKDDGYEVVEFYISQCEFNELFPSTYPIVIPLVLRENGTYIAGNTVSESIYRVRYTDDRGIQSAFPMDGVVYQYHFQNTISDESWYEITDSISYRKLSLNVI